MYLRHELKAKIIDLPHKNTIEELWVSFKYNNKSIALGVFYKAPNTPTDLFLNDFESSISALAPKYDVLICTGDFNIDFLNQEDKQTRHLIDIMNSYMLDQIIQEPTRYGKTSAKILDLILVSEDIAVKNISVKPVPEISDHSLISCEFETESKHNADPTFYTFRDYRHFNSDYFTSELEQIDFSVVYQSKDIDEKLNYLNSALIELFDAHAPIRTVKITRPKAPWITPTIKLMMNLRDRALLKFKKNKLERHWTFYKDLRNQTKYAIEREKKAYLCFKMRTNGNNKNFWRELKNMNVCSSKSAPHIPEQLQHPSEINKYFINSAKSPHPPNENMINYYADNLNPLAENFTFAVTDEIEIYKAILSIKSKAIGIDKISIEMILRTCPVILPLICHIYNFCIKNSLYPTIWKKSFVLPIPKVSNPVDYKDLRPISILCALSKPFEKILLSRIKSHLETYNIVPLHQSGFRANHSCTTALLKVTDDILKASDKKELTALILLDYSKAFDRINHRLLLSILHHIGFSARAAALLENYLSHRFQAVLLDNNTSDTLAVESGVPQGSILGPTLFILYTHEFHKHLTSCDSHFYADDTQLYLSFPESEILTANIQINNDLHNILTISNEFCLDINPSKSCFMLFGRKQVREGNLDKLDIRINDAKIPYTDCTKNLGLHMDSILKYNQHINMIIKRAICNLKLIYSNRSVLNKKCKIMLCEALVLSHLNYGNVIYGHAITKSNMHRLQLVQNSCVRLICGLSRRDHITDYLKGIGWLSIQKRIVLHSCSLYHKIISTGKPAYLYNKITFRTDVHNLNVRFKYRLTPPLHTTALYQSSFSYMITRLYNTTR